MRICTIDGCEKKHYGKGYCKLHYCRYWKNGNTTSKRIFGQDTVGNKLYKVFAGMKGRCYNTKNERYKDYGGRGIYVCDRWLLADGFSKFVSDIGPRPEGYSLDRIDNNGPYSPENCRRANKYQQASNTRKNNKVVGVSLCKFTNMRRSRINIKGKEIYLGRYKIYEDAVKVRKEFEKKSKIIY